MSDEKLRGCPFIATLGDSRARVLLKAGLPMRFPGKVPVFREMDSGDSLFLVLRGEARLFAKSQSDSVELAAAGKGEFFGEADVLAQSGKRSGSAVAAGELDVLELPKDAVRQAISDCPPLGKLLAQVGEQRSRTLKEMTDFLSRW